MHLVSLIIKGACIRYHDIFNITLRRVTNDNLDNEICMDVNRGQFCNRLMQKKTLVNGTLSKD